MLEAKEQISNEEIKKLILERGLTLTVVIDAVIEVDGIIGVGLITLADTLNDYCTNKVKHQ